MAVIASLWWLWLLLALVFGWLSIANQLRRVRSMTKGGVLGDFDKAADAFTGGLGRLFFYVGMAACAGVLLFISVVIHLIAYTRP